MTSYGIHAPEHYRPPDPSEKIIVSVEDPWSVWPLLKDSLKTRLPLKKATLNNKARNPVVVDKLPLDYIPSNDNRLRSRPPGERTPFWFRNPYCHLILVACEDGDDYKSQIRSRLRSMLQNEYREWLIVYVAKTAVTEAAAKATRRVFARLEDDFSTKKRERCCKLDVYSSDSTQWEDLCNKVVECIRNSLEQRVQFYEDEVRKLGENRFLPGWNFCTFLVVKESLAFMFEMAQLREDALREYDELEQCYSEVAALRDSKAKLQSEFGGTDSGDDQAALLEVNRKKFSQYVTADSVCEFDFRQYIFARQAALLFALQRPGEVADRGIDFMLSFAAALRVRERQLPFCLREAWVFSAAMALARTTAERHVARGGPASAAQEREFFRLQADLYLQARTKLMRLADLVGLGRGLEHTPCNSAALSMVPWPRPATWPPLTPEATARAVQKEQDLLATPPSQENQEGAGGVVGASAKQLPLAPGPLAPEANRRRVSVLALAPEAAANGTASREGVTVEGEVGPSRSGSAAEPMMASPPRSPDQGGGRRSVVGGSRMGPVLKLSEIQAAAEAALLKGLTHQGLKKGLASQEGFEELYLELTRSAADNYHRSSRRRHGVVMDGEVAAVHFKRGNLDSAVKLYEKLCARYAAERWHHLLAQVLPRLSECQHLLGDVASHLTSSVRLLSLEPGLCTQEYRRLLQREVVRLARSALKDPVSLDMSALITFAGQGGPPLELCEGDPGSLGIVVWSGLPEEVTLDALSLSLQATGGSSADENVRVAKTAGEAPVLRPGKNGVVLAIPPQRQGAYVLGALTGVLGRVRLRSHTLCSTSAAALKGGPPDSDDFLSKELPLRPAVQVAPARPLVDISPLVSGGLLIGELQWVGLVIRPLDYSLKGALLHVTPGPGLQLADQGTVELEGLDQSEAGGLAVEEGTAAVGEREELELKGGVLALPDWAAEKACVLWLQVLAVREHREESALITAYTPTATPSPSPPQTPDGPPLNDPSRRPRTPPQSEGGGKGGSGGGGVEGVRVVSVKLEYGAGRGRELQQAVALHFTEPFSALDRVASKANDGTLLLQVTLRSQLAAAAHVSAAQLTLQPNFEVVPGGGSSWLLPLTVQSGSEGALLFTVRLKQQRRGEDGKERPAPLQVEQAGGLSTLQVEYSIGGDRRRGAHSPPAPRGGNKPDHTSSCKFRHTFVLQMPVTERRVALGLLPVPVALPRVGRAVVLQWRVERLVEGRPCGGQNGGEGAGEDVEELKYELKVAHDQWMVSGRRKGHLRLGKAKGTQLTVAMACTPVVAGHIRPPSLLLPDINRGHISHSPAGPHMVCVLPADTCSSFCTTKRTGT